MGGSIGHLIPRQPVPDLSLPLSDGGHWRLSDQKPKHFTMLAFHRGMHGSMCRDYLGQLQSLHGAFSKPGVTPIAVSTDDAERACSTEARWRLKDLCVAYALSLRQAREWGLYVSRGCGRPCFEQLVNGVEKAVARQYPARGELTDCDSS
ncbi:MAG: redoxin domain-containing protein [Hyphomicrobiaceae bacterium]